VYVTLPTTTVLLLPYSWVAYQRLSPIAHNYPHLLFMRAVRRGYLSVSSAKKKWRMLVPTSEIIKISVA